MRIYANSLDVAVGQAIPEPRLVLWMADRQRVFPATRPEASATPAWVKPLVEAAFADAP